MNLLKDKDCVVGWKKKRLDPLIKTIPSKFFNFCNRKIFGLNLHDMNCGFKGYKKEAYKNFMFMVNYTGLYLLFYMTKDLVFRK